MFSELTQIWSWYDPDAFTIGVAMVIAWWFVGWSVGLIFDVVRKS